MVVVLNSRCDVPGSGSCLAALLTANRRTSDRYPKALLSISGVLGSFVSTMACLPPAFALPIGPHVHHEDGHHDGAVHSTVAFGHTLADLEPIFWPLIMVDAAMIVGCVLTAMMLAPRFISGTQVALILLLGEFRDARSPATAAREDCCTLGHLNH